MINHPNRSKKSQQVEFVPVFKATFGNGTNQIEFSFPNVNTINLTGEAPEGFDGGWVWSVPPIYPCIIITDRRSHRHVPNRMLRGPDDLKAYRAEFFGRKVWKYETAGASLADDREIYARNEANRKANFKLGREALGKIDPAVLSPDNNASEG